MNMILAFIVLAIAIIFEFLRNLSEIKQKRYWATYHTPYDVAAARVKYERWRRFGYCFSVIRAVALVVWAVMLLMWLYHIYGVG